MAQRGGFFLAEHILLASSLLFSGESCLIDYVNVYPEEMVVIRGGYRVRYLHQRIRRSSVEPSHRDQKQGNNVGAMMGVSQEFWSANRRGDF